MEPISIILQIASIVSVIQKFRDFVKASGAASAEFKESCGLALATANALERIHSFMEDEQSIFNRSGRVGDKARADLKDILKEADRRSRKYKALLNEYNIQKTSYWGRHKWAKEGKAKVMEANSSLVTWLTVSYTPLFEILASNQSKMQDDIQRLNNFQQSSNAKSNGNTNLTATATTGPRKATTSLKSPNKTILAAVFAAVWKAKIGVGRNPRFKKRVTKDLRKRTPKQNKQQRSSYIIRTNADGIVTKKPMTKEMRRLAWFVT
jgi:hypothetical protein